MKQMFVKRNKQIPVSLNFPHCFHLTSLYTAQPHLVFLIAGFDNANVFVFVTYYMNGPKEEKTSRWSPIQVLTCTSVD